MIEIELRHVIRCDRCAATRTGFFIDKQACIAEARANGWSTGYFTVGIRQRVDLCPDCSPKTQIAETPSRPKSDSGTRLDIMKLDPG